MTADSPGRSVIDRIGGGQKLFLLTLMGGSVLAAVGFSLTVFGALSEFMATTSDRVIVSGIGVGLMAAGALVSYLALR